MGAGEQALRMPAEASDLDGRVREGFPEEVAPQTETLKPPGAQHPLYRWGN